MSNLNCGGRSARNCVISDSARRAWSRDEVGEEVVVVVASCEGCEDDGMGMGVEDDEVEDGASVGCRFFMFFTSCASLPNK